jgi:sugar phosphate isomerase/epimerase
MCACSFAGGFVVKVVFGICTEFDKLFQLAEAGFDYIEVPTFDFTNASKEAFFEMKEKVSRANTGMLLMAFQLH